MLIGPSHALDIHAFASPVLIVAPHPDDESLGCGGLVALLRRRGIGVSVLVISDGGASHAGSKSWSRERLGQYREAEAHAALDRLGVARDARIFWREQDTAVPDCGAAGFDALVRRADGFLRRLRPRAIVLPWRRDPHCDHRASAAIFLAALRQGGRQPLLLEYPGWTGILPVPGRVPHRRQVKTWRLDIRRVRGLKHRAIDAHRSQLGQVIDDDPAGFVLTGRLRQRFERPYELYWEVLP